MNAQRSFVALMALTWLLVGGPCAFAAEPDEAPAAGWERVLDASGRWSVDLPAGFVVQPGREWLVARDLRAAEIWLRVTAASASTLEAQAAGTERALLQGLDGARSVGRAATQIGALEATRMDITGVLEGTAGRLRAQVALASGQEVLLALWVPGTSAEAYYPAFDQVARSVRSASSDALPTQASTERQRVEGNGWRVELPAEWTLTSQQPAGFTSTDGTVQVQLLVAERESASPAALGDLFLMQARASTPNLTVRRRATVVLAGAEALLLELEDDLASAGSRTWARAWLQVRDAVEVVLVAQFPGDQRATVVPELERVVASLAFDLTPASTPPAPGATPLPPAPAQAQAPVPALPLETRVDARSHFQLPVPKQWTIRHEGRDLIASAPDGRAGVRAHSDAGSQRSPEALRHELLRQLAVSAGGLEVLREARTPIPGAFEALVVEVRHKSGQEVWIRTLVVTLTKARRHWLWLSAREDAEPGLRSTYAAILEGYRPRD